jgi:hypothetical protein
LRGGGFVRAIAVRYVERKTVDIAPKSANVLTHAGIKTRKDNSNRLKSARLFSRAARQFGTTQFHLQAYTRLFFLGLLTICRNQ